MGGGVFFASEKGSHDSGSSPDSPVELFDWIVGADSVPMRTRSLVWISVSANSSRSTLATSFGLICLSLSIIFAAGVSRDFMACAALSIVATTGLEFENLNCGIVAEAHCVAPMDRFGERFGDWFSHDSGLATCEHSRFMKIVLAQS